MGTLDKIYAHLPIWGQNLGMSVYGFYWKRLRFGSEYEKFVREYRERETFTAEQWGAFQREQLKMLLSNASNHIPYYRDSWNREEKKAAAEGDLSRVPLLAKGPLRDAPHLFRDPRINPGLVFHTSGSTGTPIASYWTVMELRRSMALREARSANWADVSFCEPRATFSGRIVVPDPQSQGPFHRYNLNEKQVYFSAFHLSPENASQYVSALHKHKVRWLTGYAVSWYLLATCIIEKNLRVPPLKAVITTSEKVTSEMRGIMERAYQCKIYEEYSTVENAIFASECAHGNLHVSPDAGIVEILAPGGRPAAPGETGEIVTTSFIRRSQPFIRYRLGDLGIWSNKPCSCGRSMPVLREVVGRIEDVITGPDGRQMVRFHGIFVNQPNVREGQIIQEALDRIRVKIVPAEGFGLADEADITGRIRQRLGEVKVVVERVSEIPRSKSGKLQAVVSLLNTRK